MNITTEQAVYAPIVAIGKACGFSGDYVEMDSGTIVLRVYANGAVLDIESNGDGTFSVGQYVTAQCMSFPFDYAPDDIADLFDSISKE